MDKYAERRKHFKTPPIDSRQYSQELRRAQLLEEQKRKRTLQVDAFRQLDQFSDLNLYDSDDEVGEEDDPSDKPSKSMSGVAQFAAMLQRSTSDADPPPASRSPSPFIEEEIGPNQSKSKKKRKGRSKKKKPSKWVNKCMYAELLEMREDMLWTQSFDIGEAPIRDGLPDDLETAWVGLAPVPVGKRCLAVTLQSAGPSGIVPNTVLRSRLLGKVILGPFPFPLPPNTILDCILNENWRSNGVLHVLDVVRWKGQDVASCEANFRFWWRDTRLAEVPAWPPPAPHESSFTNLASSTNPASSSERPRYVFPYPTTLAPVPYIAPLSFEVILNDLLNRARSGLTVPLRLPILTSASLPKGEMEIDPSSGQLSSKWLWTANQMQEVQVTISSDGLLLYVGEAAYESGESPLSVWVPRVSYDDVSRDGAGTRENPASGHDRLDQTASSMKESPLDVFERLVRRRLIAQRASALGSSTSIAHNASTVEVEMCS